MKCQMIRLDIQKEDFSVDSWVFRAEQLIKLISKVQYGDTWIVGKFTFDAIRLENGESVPETPLKIQSVCSMKPSSNQNCI